MVSDASLKVQGGGGGKGDLKIKAKEKALLFCKKVGGGPAYGASNRSDQITVWY